MRRDATFSRQPTLRSPWNALLLSKRRLLTSDSQKGDQVLWRLQWAGVLVNVCITPPSNLLANDLPFSSSSTAVVHCNSSCPKFVYLRWGFLHEIAELFDVSSYGLVHSFVTICSKESGPRGQKGIGGQSRCIHLWLRWYDHLARIHTCFDTCNGYEIFSNTSLETALCRQLCSEVNSINA